MNLANPNLVAAAFQCIAQHSHQVFFVYDPNTCIFIHLSPAFAKLWGVEAEAVLADPSSLVARVHPEDHTYVEEKYHDALTGTMPQGLQFRINRPDGSICWLSLSAFWLGDEGEGGLLTGIAEDISESVEYQHTLRKFAAKKNSVLEILSHDLAGPLGTVQGLTGLLASRVGKYNDPQLNEPLALISKTCQRSIHLIRELVKTEFLETSQAALIKSRVDLVLKVREVLEQYQASQQEIVKTFRLEASADVIWVNIDEVKFMQVINNLISNSIKFTPDSGIITTRVTDEPDTQSVLVFVEDNGIGIPAHLHEGLFDKFTKARRPGLRGEESVGLGMSIIKTIVEWHGGTIWFRSEENQGTAFYIRIPRE